MSLQLPSEDPYTLEPGIYSTDPFNKNPLFMVKAKEKGMPSKSLYVKSWNEAFALHGNAEISDVNPRYIAALITGFKSTELSPYKRIKRMPRSNHILITSDFNFQKIPSQPFSQGAGKMEAEILINYIRERFLKNMKAYLPNKIKKIGCEQSTGLDSNAIIGSLIFGLKIEPTNINVVTGDSESGPLIEKFRDFYNLIPMQCNNFKSSISIKDLLHRDLGAPQLVEGINQSTYAFEKIGCKLIFSGFGGDQGLSHNASNITTDLFKQRRFKELYIWTGNKFFRQFLSRALLLAIPKLTEILINQKIKQFIFKPILKEFLTPKGFSLLGPFLKDFNYPWELQNYVGIHQSIKNRLLSDWVSLRSETERRIASSKGIEKVFPFLDEHLIATLLNQDPYIFGEKDGQGRYIFRSSFKDFLPQYLKENPKKDRLQGSEVLKKYNVNDEKIEFLNNFIKDSLEFNKFTKEIFELPKLRSKLDKLLSEKEINNKVLINFVFNICNLYKLNYWFEDLDN